MNVKLFVIIGGILVSFYLLATKQMPSMLSLKTAPKSESSMGNVAGMVDMGMYDVENSNAFGTTTEAERRVNNYGVRKEFHHNPMPLGYGCGDCDKAGVPDPTMGDTHICKSGPPSKRMIDAYGGSHFMLPHMCAGSTGKCTDEPTQLGNWWCRNGCSNPESVGLDIRPICTRCGN
jgi:hypothetical protein